MADLAEMSVEEFLEHGFDEDDEEEGEKAKDSETIPSDSKLTKGSNKKHKNQLSSLKEKDPEFYQFLQENDEGLLAFSGSEEEDEEDDEEEEDEEEDGEENEDNGNEENNLSDGDSNDEIGERSDDDGEDKQDDNVSNKRQKVVTEKMIIKWTQGLEENSLKSLKFVFRAFHAAVHSLVPEDGEEKEKKKKSPHYSVESGFLYNQLMKRCLKYSVSILEKNLSTAKRKKFHSNHLPSSHKMWSKIKVPLKQYLCDILQILRIHTDVSVLTILLKHCQALCVFYACFPKISKMLLKRLIRMWSSGDEHVRVMAFLCIRTLSFLTPKLYEFIVKKLYLGFVRNSKFVNLKTKPLIVFMKNSLIEMFSYNEALTYKQGFLYIRQLAITLRNAITVKKKDSLQSVYNWQYISCLQLWSQVVSDLYGEVLKPLVYPVVQINIGVIKLVPAARYYPLRFHCIQSLNYISKKSGVYIPTAALVLRALESNEFLRKPNSSEKIPDFSGILKVSKSHLRTKGFQDCTIEMAVESLLEHYAVFSNSIAFPELIFPSCHRLKHLIKNAGVSKLSKDMKMVVEKLQLHSETMKSSRDQVNFSPKDIDAVKQWEDEHKSSSNELVKFLATWHSMKKITHNEGGHEDEVEIPIQKTKGKEKRKQSDTKKAMVPAKKKKINNAKEKQRTFDDNEDIVEDYDLSDDM